MGWICRICGDRIVGLKLEHCPLCHETFTCTAAGDMHRVGRHGVTAGPSRRRCLTPEEMLDKGMTRNTRGRWATGRAEDRFWDFPKE
jgi:gp42